MSEYYQIDNHENGRIEKVRGQDKQPLSYRTRAGAQAIADRYNEEVSGHFVVVPVEEAEIITVQPVAGATP